MGHYAPYGEVWHEQGTAQTPFGFTGEPTDGNGLVHLRARYYNPTLGVFPSLDPIEDSLTKRLSLNRYAYVYGNSVNFADPSGMIGENSSDYSTCNSAQTSCVSSPFGKGKYSGDQVNDPIDFDLFNDWGVILTVSCGESYSWQQEKQTIRSAFSLVDSKLQGLDAGRFIDSLGGLEFRQIGKDINSEKDVYAETTHSFLIEWGNDIIVPSLVPNLEKTVVHELGHVFERRTHNPSYGMYNAANRPESGALNDWLPKPSDAMVSGAIVLGGYRDIPDTRYEKIADTFMLWVYEELDTSKNAGQIAQAYMEGQPVYMVSQGSPKLEQPSQPFYEVTTVGIQGWSRLASIVASRYVAILARAAERLS